MISRQEHVCHGSAGRGAYLIAKAALHQCDCNDSIRLLQHLLPLADTSNPCGKLDQGGQQAGLRNGHLGLAHYQRILQEQHVRFCCQGGLLQMHSLAHELLQ